MTRALANTFNSSSTNSSVVSVTNSVINLTSRHNYYSDLPSPFIRLTQQFVILRLVQGGSNMTGTNCDLFTHKSSRSYLNHLVFCMVQQPNAGQGHLILEISRSSARGIGQSQRPDNTQHSDRHSCPRRDLNVQLQQAIGRSLSS